MKKTFADILGSIETQRQKRIAAKLPSWSQVSGLVFPDELCLQQCSSESAAAYKAAEAAGTLAPSPVIADITGGLGVDSLAFSRIASRVVHVEKNARLSGAARGNFALLGAGNIECVCTDAADFLRSSGENFDMIYADPARRDRSGRKVFLPEDCAPDILALLPLIFGRSAHLMLKLSPMADITMLGQRFGGRLREIHVVSAGGECKELLCMLEAGGGNGDFRIVVPGALSFTPGEEKECRPIMLGRIPQKGETLFVPAPGLAKAGCFKLLSRRFPLLKLDPDVHIYVPDSGRADGTERSLPGNRYEVLDVFPFGNAGLAQAAAAYPSAEVSARGLPLSSEQLCRRLGCVPDASRHIFGVTSGGKGALIACRRTGAGTEVQQVPAPEQSV